MIFSITFLFTLGSLVDKNSLFSSLGSLLLLLFTVRGSSLFLLLCCKLSWVRVVLDIAVSLKKWIDKPWLVWQLTLPIWHDAFLHSWPRSWPSWQQQQQQRLRQLQVVGFGSDQPCGVQRTQRGRYSGERSTILN